MKAQTTQKEKDSILLIFHSQKNSEKMKSLDKLFKYYVENNSDSAKIYAIDLKNLSQKHKNLKYQAIAYTHLGDYFLKSSNFLNAEENYQQAVNIYKQLDFQKDLAETYKKLSRSNYYNNQLSKSIDNTIKSLKIYENTNNKQGIIEGYSNLGTLYSASGNYKKSLKYYFSILNQNNSVSENMKIKLFHNIGTQYKRLNMADSALFYYGKSLKIAEKMNVNNAIISNYYSIGDLYGCYIKEKDSAIMYLNKALTLSGNNNINLQKAIYATIGKTYLENKEFSKSILPLKKSLKIAEKIQNLNGKEVAHYNLYQSYKNLAKYRQSVFHLEKYIEAKDSIKYEEAKIRIENLQSKYENEKNKLKIEKLEQKQKADRQIRNMLFIGILLLFIIFILIIRSYILTGKKNILSHELLKNEKEKLDQDLQHKTRELTSQALMMLQKNKLLKEILHSLSQLKITGNKTSEEISGLKRRLRYSMHSEKDWELFRQYFEQINKNFFPELKKISSTITPAEKKLAALIKLRFSIKESASLLNISDGSIKTARYNLRKKLGLKREDNIYDFLNNL